MKKKIVITGPFTEDRLQAGRSPNPERGAADGVKDLEDEIEGLHARQVRVEEEINGIQEFIEQKKEAIKEAQALIKKYEKQSENVKEQPRI